MKRREELHENLRGLIEGKRVPAVGPNMRFLVLGEATSFQHLFGPHILGYHDTSLSHVVDTAPPLVPASYVLGHRLASAPGQETIVLRPLPVELFSEVPPAVKYFLFEQLYDLGGPVRDHALFPAEFVADDAGRVALQGLKDVQAHK